MQLTARDRRIIQLVYQHRFLRSSHLVELVHDSTQTVLRRLQLLYHHGYLERPRSQIEYYHQGGSRHIVYGIGAGGASLLKTELGYTFGKVRWAEKNRKVGRIFLEHALLVSDVMVTFELACQETGRIRFVTEDELLVHDQSGHLSRPFRWSVTVKDGLKLGIIPDRVFALEYLDQGGMPNRAFFFLEADRGTMPVKRRYLGQTSFYRKLLAYEATWSQSIHSTRFGFHRFRVLTVTKSADRTRSLMAVCSQLKRGQGLFLFADWASVEKPSDLFSPIWMTGRQGESPALLV
jgi:hypothetical protein